MAHGYPADNTRIITDHGKAFFAESKKTVVLDGPVWNSALIKIPGFGLFRELILAIKIWGFSLKYRNRIPVLTYAGGRGMIFALLQYLSRPFIKHRTHVVLDALFMPLRKGLLGFFDRAKLHIFSKSVDLAFVWGETDPETFAKEFGIPKEKFHYHHYHTTRENFEFEVRNDGYIFAGGNGARDYKTLIEAVKDINYPVFIATTLPDIPSLAREWSHITVKGLPGDEFYQKMAACRFLVECHDPQFLRTAGHQTMLNAMWMGKPVVLADKRSALGYIVNEEEGLVVEAGDVEGVRKSIFRLLNDSELEARIAQNAMKKAQQPEYTIPETLRSIYNIAIKLHCDKNGLDLKGRLIE
jgi:glycosyltransferase involved in cell wall biosynthesis